MIAAGDCVVLIAELVGLVRRFGPRLFCGKRTTSGVK